MITQMGENFVKYPMRMSPNNIWGPYICSLTTRSGFFRTMNPLKIWLPSSGGNGIMLNMASMILIWIKMNNIDTNAPWSIPPATVRNRNINPPTKARSRLDAGPAKATIIMSFLGFLKNAGLTGTGFAQPNPTNRIIIEPIGSRCASGFRVSLP